MVATRSRAVAGSLASVVEPVPHKQVETGQRRPRNDVPSSRLLFFLSPFSRQRHDEDRHLVDLAPGQDPQQRAGGAVPDAADTRQDGPGLIGGGGEKKEEKKRKTLTTRSSFSLPGLVSV